MKTSSHLQNFTIIDLIDLIMIDLIISTSLLRVYQYRSVVDYDPEWDSKFVRGFFYMWRQLLCWRVGGFVVAPPAAAIVVAPPSSATF